MKEQMHEILMNLNRGRITVSEAQEQLLLLFSVSGALPLPKCKCGQNTLPYYAQTEILRCSRCGNDH